MIVMYLICGITQSSYRFKFSFLIIVNNCFAKKQSNVVTSDISQVIEVHHTILYCLWDWEDRFACDRER